MAALQLQLMRSDDPKARTKLLDNLLEAEERLAYSQESAEPDLHLASTDRVPLPEFQKILQTVESLLEYVLADPHSFCLAVTHNDARIIPLPAGREQIGALVKDYLSSVKTEQRAAQIEGTLYSMLIDPIPKTFRTKHLIIVPDQELNTLPYEALHNVAGDYLLRSHVVFYAPSATTL